MSPLAFGLIAVAAVLHATWNVILKTAGDPLRTAGRAMTTSVVVGLPLAIVGWLAVGRPSIPAEAIGLGIVSGLLEVAYFVLLAGAYRRGDLSVVYPIARGTAPLLSVAVGVLILGERLAPPGFAGVGALVAGILVVQQPWRALSWLQNRRAPEATSTIAGGDGDGRPANTAVLFALGTGVVIAAYSAVDRVGARLVEPWLFAAIIFPVGAAGLAVWIRIVDWRNAAGSSAAVYPLPQAAPWSRAGAAGIITLAAYLMILVAYTQAPLAVVAPLRESAVVLVSGWGSFRLGEATNGIEGARRIAGAVLVLAGAAFIALAR